MNTTHIAGRCWGCGVGGLVAGGLLGAAAILGLRAEEELVTIDFRNHIPGVLDAPVFEADGVTRLEDGAFYAQLFYSPYRPDSLVPAGIPAWFQKGAQAGYWEPQEIALPDVGRGDRIFAAVVVVESLRTFPFSSAGGYVWSDVLTLVVTNSPMPLLGLESLVWFPERLCVRRQADQIILEFEHQGASRYELLATSSLQQPISWTREFTHTGLEEFGQIISVTNALTSSPRFFRLRRWR